jgi:UDP-N-acetylmuramate dehydrogenase
MKFKENISLAQFSHYKIGGNARFFFEPKNEKEVAWAVREAKLKKIPVFVLGGGTNLLIGDAGFNALVLRMNLKSIALKKAKRKSGALIEVGAGVSMAKLLDYATTKSYSGLEWAGGLPGTLGGAIRGNAGCFGGEMKDSIVSVRSFDPKKMKIAMRSLEACRFDYRDSVFKTARGKNAAANEIILSATLAMKKGNKKAIARSIREKIEYRQKNHPMEYPNIGSMFKNIPLSHLEKQAGKKYKMALAEQSFELRGSQFSIKIDPFPVLSAAKFISESGLRGVSFGGAMISPKHPNFIVNILGASSVDVENLMLLAKTEVKKKFGVVLEEEIQTV